MTLKGIDVSGWQPENITTLVKEYDFALIKATGATNYTSAKAVLQAQGALAAGKPIGFYHFALEKEEDKGAVAEAEHFLKAVTPFLGKNPVLVLDFEAKAASDLPFSWAITWLQHVEKKTGIKPLFYTFESIANKPEARQVREAGFELWVASFGKGDRVKYNQAPAYPKTQWDAPKIFQFTETGRLDGYDKNLDLNLFYGDLNAFKQLGSSKTVTPPTPPTVQPDNPRKTGQQLAEEVLAGHWGNGEDRIKRLRAKGYNAEAVQAEVNLVLTRRNVKQHAQDVRDGKYGNGDDRKARLKAAGIDYDTVQNEINRILSKPSVSTLADQVIAGKWGVDPIRSARLRVAGHDAKAVQAEVNRKLNT